MSSEGSNPSLSSNSCLIPPGVRRLVLGLYPPGGEGLSNLGTSHGGSSG